MQEPGSEGTRAGAAGRPADDTAGREGRPAGRAARGRGASQPAEQRAAAGRLNRDHVLSLPQAQMAGTVAAYFSVGT